MENKITSDAQTTSPAEILTPQLLLEHWQGHRRLTRRVIEAFPEDKIYDYSIGGMRPFADIAMEIIGLSAPGIHGIVSGNWTFDNPALDKALTPPSTKQGILELWDIVTNEIDTLWPQIPAKRYQETDLAFGQYEGTIQYLLFYLIDNEIHHRGQGYVYLRSLGIEPPAFWDRN